ncbi:LuxR family transcriptional regulator [Planktothrix sp. FACHB-1355]|uniref:LuxR family transcriptional regulator n=1 Tax=Aerosakkonema funiforme FACHB-1375 TaxID=2949571 RepID=A0A926VH61_9CYAN|nr:MULTISPECIES: LuxR C-terminal-related transcriptional regulator [Oscillatoriales]MBD2183048.1 LuxR family transcriptional regulator [Aerosakkonema funiforme FACHB-1375]MBD3557768.1 LuxR family transcriptional regulator [Planktothrix sp. FACHB-1355]
MKALTTAPAIPNIPAKQSKIAFLQNIETSYFLKGVLEGFIDGILILTEQGELLHANQTATKICDRLRKVSDKHNLVPEEIWRVCQSLIESRDLFPDRKMTIESEISKGDSIDFRVRVRWLKLEQIERPCLLVTLEDRHQSLQRIVINDAYLYNLTPREGEVWLLYRANYSYKEIADKLYITLNTVKKHMKNIHAKRKAFSDLEM